MTLRRWLDLRPHLNMKCTVHHDLDIMNSDIEYVEGGSMVPLTNLFVTIPSSPHGRKNHVLKERRMHCSCDKESRELWK